MKPYSESCDQNREPILSVIQPLFANATAVLEIGSGTGQHAVFFAEKMPHLTWHTSDCPEYHDGIKLWLAEAGRPNVQSPLVLDVSRSAWPEVVVDGVFSANTAHIMHWRDVEAMMAGVGQLLPSGGLFALYGPFNYNGQFSSESNARFDGWLKSRDPGMGVRDFEAVNTLAKTAGMQLEKDYEMPVNNRILCWKKL
ncbi:MAG: class I SAM-dependent methyltransferase [Sedimenticola sp.]|nr:class I SAM-dependent methyltransferase [Sedimenticola sp.]